MKAERDQHTLFITLLLQSPIRCCDKPAAGGLAPRPFDVLHEYASGLRAPVSRTFMNNVG